MSKNLIYCYSGSGNCLDIARNIAKKLGDTDIVMMRTAPAITDAREAERVGFVFPCYAGGLPERWRSMCAMWPWAARRISLLCAATRATPALA